MGDTYPLILSNLVKQGTVLGPVLNNCSLDRFSKESFGYNFGSVGIKPLEFVDDIANPSSSRQTAVLSNKLLENIQHEKRVNFSAEKCELLKINSIGNDGLLLNDEDIKSVRKVRYNDVSSACFASELTFSTRQERAEVPVLSPVAHLQNRRLL